MTLPLPTPSRPLTRCRRCRRVVRTGLVQGYGPECAELLGLVPKAPRRRPTGQDDALFNLNEGDPEMNPNSIAVMNLATSLAPVPESEDAPVVEWIRHHAASGLAAHVAFQSELKAPSPTLGLLAKISVYAAHAIALLVEETDGEGDVSRLLYDLTPEAGALNGEWVEFLTDALDKYGINPADIDPDLNPADFKAPLSTVGVADA